jgi:hypothetical protein
MSREAPHALIAAASDHGDDMFWIILELCAVCPDTMNTMGCTVLVAAVDNFTLTPKP